MKLCWLCWLPKLAMGAKVDPGDLYCAERADSAPLMSGLPCEIKLGAPSEACCSIEEKFRPTGECTFKVPGVLFALEGSFMLWIGRPRRLSRALQSRCKGTN